MAILEILLFCSNPTRWMVGGFSKEVTVWHCHGEGILETPTTTTPPIGISPT